MAEPFDTGSDPLNAALDRLKTWAQSPNPDLGSEVDDVLSCWFALEDIDAGNEELNAALVELDVAYTQGQEDLIQEICDVLDQAGRSPAETPSQQRA